jgi:pilus assembly protein CpaB
MKRSLVAAVAAVLLAVVGCGAVWLYARGADARALAGKQPVTVLVATKRIPAGTSGADVRARGLVEAVPMPRSAVPADALSSVDAALDRLVLTGDIQPRQLLLRGAFDEAATASGGLAMPDGKLAVTVQMTAAANVAGYVRPGAKIAIFDTYTESATRPRQPNGQQLTLGEGRNHITRVLLPRVEVIAIGARGDAGAATSAGEARPSTQDEGGDATAKPVQPTGEVVMVTVAVSQDEAERLILAVHTGTLYMALLDDDSDVRPGAGVDNTRLFP